MKNTCDKIVIILFLIFNLIFVHQSIGQNNIASRYIFNTITIENGLPVNFIDYLYKDSKGFIWVSTQGGGLSRYDGYEFIHFNVNSSPISLKNNFIRKTCEDNFNRLWIISDSGIDIIDLSTMSKSGLSYEGELFDKIVNTLATSVFNDSEGNIWIAAEDKLYKLRFDKEGKISNILELAKEHANTSFGFSTISEVGNDVWVGGSGCIYKIHNQSDFLNPQPVSDILKFETKFFISGILEKDKMVWIGSEIGLFRYNLIDNSIRHYLHDVNNPHSLSQDMVTDICITNEGTLAVGTLRGLNFYDLFSDSFERVTHYSVISLNSDFVNCLLPDGNNFWVGTEAGGINKMTLRSLAIKSYRHNDRDSNSISPNPVNAILEDQYSNLWIGTVEGGLNLKLKGQDRFIHYRAGSGGLSHNSVSELAQDRNGNLWIGTWGGGINIMEIDKLPNVSYRPIPTVAGLDYIGILRYDAINNGMWIGTNRNIFYFDIATNSIKEPLSTDMTKNIKGVLGGMVIEDKLWLGTSNGVLLIDLKSFDRSSFKCKAEFLKLDNPNMDNLFLKNVTTMLLSKDGAIWLGSNGYGFSKLMPEQDGYKCELYTTEHGLTNNNVFGILEDEEGMIWLSSGYGISYFNPINNRFVNYTQSDGLIDNQYYWNACFKSPTSKNLYFGGICGLTELKENHLQTKPEQNKVIFTKLQILNETVWFNNNKYIKKDISYADRLDLHESDKSFSIEFSALDYDNPSTVLYSYRLVGFDDKWIDVPANRRFASYTNLQPGRYTLQVKYMSGATDWSDNITDLKIEVHPFFYKTTWFIGIMVCLLTFLALYLYKWRISSLKRQRQMLHQKVEERTKELEEQKTLLEEQAEELKLQNNILYTQNEKISNQQRQLISMSKKVEEATSDRMSFFTNITHEFRTPITLIIGPIERALKLSTNPKVIEQLQFVARNSKHLLSLVNQLMDFRKVESDNISIAPTSGNLLSYMDEILLPFESFARERGIQIRKFYRLNPPYVLFDEEAMHKVVTNLLSNAIKYTPDNGIVSVYLASIKDKEENSEKLYISISDSGTGIKEDDLENIFNRFFQSKDNAKFPIYGQSSTGIGLYLCKKIVSIHGGSIEAKNNHSAGASLRVLLPLERDIIPDIQDSGTELESIDEDSKVYISSPDNHKLTIPVVEDNNDMRQYIRSILLEYYNILEAENGIQALAILKSKSVDFIISDLMMPEMDGMELSQKVKADFAISHIPFLMLTAKTSNEAKIDSYKVGVDEFLQKPFDEELLLARINNILETRKMYQRKFSLYMNVEELNISEESDDEKFIKKAVEIVKENYKDPYFDVGNFIDAMGISKSLLNKKMQTLIGQSAGHFIRNYRLNLAHEMILKNKNMTISEIAYEVGFNDPKYFTRCFTKQFGVAPSALAKDGK